MSISTTGYIILTILLILILIILAKYNKLVKLQNRVKKAKANISIFLKKRFDLIPNLVECVKSYSKYEGSTLEEIVSLRNKYENKDLPIIQAEKMNNKLNNFLAIIEKYPELKADKQYINLQSELSRIENELERARKIYNDEVTKYNIAIETVPSNIVASIFAFKKASLFKAEPEEKENVKISFMGGQNE